MSYLDLVLTTGELVRIEVPDKYFDDCHETLQNAIKCREWWCPTQFEGCKATYLGMTLDRVNMNLVMGML